MSIDLDHKLSVLAAAEEAPDAVAVRSNGDCLTYGVLAEKVRDILPQLGDARPYPLIARPDLDTLIKVFALLERKQPILLLHPGLTEHERNTLLASIEGLDHHFPENTAVILFTSGPPGCPNRRFLLEKHWLPAQRPLEIIFLSVPAMFGCCRFRPRVSEVSPF